MLAYANEAENEACLRSRLLLDSSTAAVCRIDIVSGTAVYDYDPRVIFILRARIAGDKWPLTKASRVLLDERQPAWEDETGDIKHLVMGMYSGRLMLYRKPVSSGVLNLTVIRYPLNPMANTSDSPEINAYHHPALVLWMKHRVYNNQDSELFDKNRADIHQAMFAQKFGARTTAPLDVLSEMQIYNDQFSAADGYF